MALLFTESFDGVTNLAHLALGKWAVIGTGTSLVAGRNGNGLQVNGASGSMSWVDFATADRHATIIVGFALKPTTIPAGYNFFQVGADAGRDASVSHVSLISGASGGLTVYGPGQGVTLGTFPAGTLTATVWQYFEIKVVIADSGGSIEVKVDQVSKGVVTGDTKYGTAAVAHGVAIQAPTNGDVVYDDLYVLNGAGTRNNGFLGDCKVECIRPDGNGNSSQLLGSDNNRTDNYLLVDEQAVNDADYVGSAVDGEQDTYAFGNLATTAGTVAGVQLTARALKMDAPAKSVALLSRVGTTETAGSNNALTTAHRNYLRMMETDPATANWTIANVNAAEFGVKIAP